MLGFSNKAPLGYPGHAGIDAGRGLICEGPSFIPPDGGESIIVPGANEQEVGAVLSEVSAQLSSGASSSYYLPAGIFGSGAEFLSNVRSDYVARVAEIKKEWAKTGSLTKETSEMVSGLREQVKNSARAQTRIPIAFYRLIDYGRGDPLSVKKELAKATGDYSNIIDGSFRTNESVNKRMLVVGKTGKVLAKGAVVVQVVDIGASVGRVYLAGC